MSFPVRAHGGERGGTGSLPRAFLTISSKGEDGFHFAPDSCYRGCRISTQGAHETDGIMKWKRNLATRTAPETWSHSEQNSKSVLTCSMGSLLPMAMIKTTQGHSKRCYWGPLDKAHPSGKLSPWSPSASLPPTPSNELCFLPDIRLAITLRDVTSDTDTAAAAAKSLQSCLTLCHPTDSSPPGSPVPGTLQARTLEWVAISFSNA